MKKIALTISLLIFFIRLSAQPQSLSLHDCLNMALSNNARIQVKQEAVKVAEDKRKAAKTAYFPKIDAMFSYLHLSDEMYLLSEDKFLPIGTKMADGSFGFRQDQVNNQWTMVNGQPVPLDANGQPFNPKTNPEKILWKDYTTIPREELAVDMRNTFVGGLSLIQPIYMGGRIYQANKMAAIGVDIAKTQENAERAEVLFDVEANYWMVISLQNKLKAAQEYKHLLDKLYENITALEAEGMAVKADVLKVRVKQNEVNMSYTKASNGLSLAKMSLCRQIGLPPSADIRLVDEQPEPQEQLYAKDINFAYTNRSEIQSLEKLVDLSKSKEKIALAGYLPDIGLTANYMFTNPDFFNGFEKHFSGSWNIGVIMKIPILHWGEQTYKIRSAKHETRLAEIQLNDVRTQIELQLNQATFKLSEAEKQAQMADNNFEQAEENLRYAKTAFDEGMVGVTDLLEAQAAWYAAYSEKKDAEINVALNNLYLKKANGLLNNNAKEIR